MSIKTIVSDEISNFFNATGKLPKIIYLHPYTRAELARELGVIHPLSCPHCGNNLLMYGDYLIEELPQNVAVAR